MTAEEEKKLLALGERLSAVSPWQPACVRDALLACGRTVSGFHLRDVTLRMWLQLDALKSPVIDGNWSPHPEQRVSEILRTLTVLTGETVTLGDLMARIPPSELERIQVGIIEHVAAAFSTQLELDLPTGKTVTGQAPGWGMILSLYYSLRKMGSGRDEALDTPLSEAFAMNAIDRWNQGWEIRGLGYAQKEAIA